MQSGVEPEAGTSLPSPDVSKAREALTAYFDQTLGPAFQRLKPVCRSLVRQLQLQGRYDIDWNDLHQAVFCNVWKWLEEDPSRAATIEDLDKYLDGSVRLVVAGIRRGHALRELRYQLNTVFKSHTELACWHSGKSVVAGFAAQQGQPPVESSTYEDGISEHLTPIQFWKESEIISRSLETAVLVVLRRAGGPIYLSELCILLARHLGLLDQAVLRGSEEPVEGDGAIRFPSGLPDQATASLERRQRARLALELLATKPIGVRKAIMEECDVAYLISDGVLSPEHLSRLLDAGKQDVDVGNSHEQNFTSNEASRSSGNPEKKRFKFRQMLLGRIPWLLLIALYGSAPKLFQEGR